MTRKQGFFILAAFSIVHVNRWLDLVFVPGRTSDVYGFWSRLIPLVVGSVAYLIWLGVLVAGSRRGGGPRQAPHGS